jgi:class 3 adenylate cyclase/predicted ATPase
VDSTTLAARLDPEEWRATVSSYQRAATDAITRFEGEVVRYIGDGIMAFFGYPAAHDNDAERAVRAGLAILDTIAQLNQQPEHAKLAVRIGIDSGRVVVSASAGGGQGVDAFGDTANIAARVQVAADAGAVMVSDATQRLVSGLFVVEDRGAQTLKGIAQLVQLYRVIRLSGVRGRFEAVSAAGGLTGFVGREDELHSLLSRWQRVVDGEGQVALIIGEAGIGKSRLLQRFHEQITGTPHTWVGAGAGVFFQNTPFYPISAMLRQMIGDVAAYDPLKELAPRLTAAGLSAVEAIPLFAPLLNLPLPPDYPPSPLSPEQQRRRLLATLVEWVLGAANAQPLVIAIEDLHWADPSTLELIQLLVEQGATARLLLLYTARPEFHAPWAIRAHHTQITLNRLSARHVRTMVGEVAAQKALSDETIATVVERTGGVPLFVEELTRAVLESGNPKLTGGEIPATLHDSLMARLDRLGIAKEVIQVGAVIGSDFSYELLHAVHQMAEADLQHALHSLTDAELLYVRGIAPEATYQFKHALIRDAAYEALLKSRRKELHLSVARAIDAKFPAFKETHPEVLARHWTEAGEPEAASTEWQRAGERAVERRAYREAVGHFSAALQSLKELTQTPERERWELRLLTQLGPAIMTLKGFGAPECDELYLRAYDLCERIGENSDLYTVLWGQWMARSVQAKWDEALFLSQRLLAIAEDVGDPVLLLEANHASWNTCLHRGALAQAAEHITRGLALYSPERDHSQLSRYGGHDPGVCAYSHASINLWLLGNPEQSIAMSREGLSLAGMLKDHFSTARANAATALIHQFRRDAPAVAEYARITARISEEHGFPYWSSYANFLLGWALCGEKGRAEEGIALMRQSLARYLGTGAGTHHGHFLSLLAERLAKEGRTDEGLALLAEAGTLLNNGERFCEAELYQLNAELLMTRSRRNEAEAEEKLRAAIAVSWEQGAKSWELRATISLARLHDRQGNRDEARTMLAGIYNWFTEGFDTADLRDAKALLDQLN